LSPSIRNMTPPEGTVRKITIDVLKSDRAGILDEIESRGERFVIERNGRPVAALISLEDLRILEEMHSRVGVQGAISRRILLVEDNPVNQRLVVPILEKEGCRVVVAANGEEAIAKHEQETFDLIFMDIEMPMVDGLQATAAIREKEKLTGQHIPIVAFTANAAEEYRDRCLKAGMDAYLSKPSDRDELLNALASFCPGPRHTDEGTAHSEPKPPAQEAAFDLEATLDQVGGDEDLVREIAALFLESSPGMLDKLADAVEKHNIREIQRAAHTIKGSVLNFHAKPAAEAALALEHFEAGEDTVRLQSLHKQVCDEAGTLQNALRAFLGGEPR